MYSSREFVQQRPHLRLILATIADRREARIVQTEAPTGRRASPSIPHRFLHDDVDVIERRLRLALQHIAELAAARIVAGARHVARVPRSVGCTPPAPALQPLMIAQFDASEIHHAVHHRDFDVLSLAGRDCADAARRECRSPDASPVPESPICAPATHGGPSGSPVVLIAPPIACATFS